MPAPISSLARQLQGISAKRAPIQSRHKASLLFDGHEAADIDRDTILTVGREGLLDLIQMNPLFGAFENSLFSDSLKDQDRMLLTKPENVILDSQIERFLRMLSPYFLRKGAFKALEWLIRRFKINEMNVDAIMECILPYHETRHFVQFVRLLAIPSNSIFLFLQDSVQKSGVQLDRNLLVDKCIREPSLLKFLFDMMAKSSADGVTNSTLTSFMACMVIQYLDSKPSINDSDLRIVLPSLLDILRTTDVDRRAAGQMILAFLSTKVCLSSNAMTGLLDAVTVDATPALLHSSILCMVTVCQNQPKLKSFPKNVYQRLIQTETFPKVIVEISNMYQAENLLEPLLKKLIQSYTPNQDDASDSPEATIFASIVSGSCLETTTLRRVLELSLQSYISSVIECDTPKIMGAGSLLRQVYEKNVAILDSIIDAEFKLCNDTGDKGKLHRAALQKLMTSFLKGTMLESVDDKGTTLYLSLHHPQPEVRLLAIEKLQSILDTDLLTNEKTSMHDIARETLSVLITDQDQTVATAALSFPNLVSYVPINELSSFAADLLASKHTETRLRAAAAQVLCKLLDKPDCPMSCCEVLLGTIWRTEKSTVAATLLASFLPALLQRIGINTAASVEFGQKFVENVNLQQQQQSEQVQETPKDQSSPHTLMNIATIKFLGDALRTSTIFRAFVIQNAVHSKFDRARLVGILALAGEIKSVSQLDKDTLTLVPFLMKNLSEIPTTTRNPVTNIIGIIDSNRIVMSGKDAQTFAIVKIVLEIIKKLSQPASWLDSEAATQSVHTCTLKGVFLAVLAVKNQAIREHLVEKFLDLVGTRNIVSFCASLWIAANNSNIGILGLTIVKKFISSSSAKAFDYQLAIPSILLALVHADHHIRSAAMGIMKVICSEYGKLSGLQLKLSQENIYGYEYFYGSKSSEVGYLTVASAARFANQICNWQHEIIADACFLKNNIHTALRRGDEAKIKYQEDVLGFLLTNICAFGIVDAQIQLVSLLENVDSPLKLKGLFPLVESNTAIVFSEMTCADLGTEKSTKEVELVTKHATLLGLLTQSYSSAAVASLFQSRSGRYLKSFCSLLSPNTFLKISDAHKQLWCTVNACALEQITDTWISSIQVEKCQVVFTALIDLIAFGDGEISAKVKIMLKPLPLTGQAILPILERIQQHLSNNLNPSTSKRVKGQAADDNGSIVAGVALLELLQFKENMTDFGILIGPLFDILAALLNADIVQTLTEVDYFKQLLLSTLELIFKVDAEKEILSVNEDSIRIDLVVQCIRLTDNPQTHNSALLLLSTIASVAPQSVLINIMQVFTFMGANILRQDDSYSFHVIQQTLQTIIPALMQHLDGDDFAGVKPIMEVFVQALPHIPEHRRLRLFTLLVQILGVDKHLGSMLALIQSNSIISSYLVAQRASDANQAISFGLNLLQEFSHHDQLKALIKISVFQQSLPNQNVQCNSPLLEPNSEIKTVRRIKLQLTNFVSQALKSKALIHSATAEVAKSSENFSDLHLKLIELLLVEIDTTSLFATEVQIRPGSSDAKFSKLYLNALQEALGLVNNLLPLAMFMHVTGELLKRKEEGICHRSLVMLRQRLVSLEGTDELDHQVFVPVLTILVSMLKTKSTKAKILENKQLVMECISSTADLVGKNIPKVITECFTALLADHCIRSENDNIASSTIVCLSSLSVVLGPRIVPFIPTLLPTVIHNGQAALASNADTRSIVVSAVFGFIVIFIETLPQFVSPYLGDLIGFVAEPRIESMTPRITQLASAISSGLARHISARIIFDPMSKQLTTALKASEFSTVSICKLLADVISNTPQPALIDCIKPLGAIMIQGFGYRCSGPGAPVAPKSLDIENILIGAFVVMMMKINENIFRPLFLKVVDWATSEMLEKNGWTIQGISTRQQLLYRLTDRLFSELKSIFVPYLAYLLENILSTLHRFTENNVLDADVWILMVSNLKSCFLYHGTNDFITSDRLQTVLKALIKQIEVVEAHDVAYKDNMLSHLVPCIGQLAVTFRSEKVWKGLTQQVLKLTRSDDANVKWTCIKVLHEMYSRLGEEMLVYFPEAIPFIAELMEDDNEDVEKSCQELCLLIQHYLGEPIQHYFSA
ncbi:snoRNA-binding rRNA-processing protein utp10 [Batrachochytrium dendrobatidis]